MKIKKDFILKEIAGESIVVPVGENLVDFGAMIVLNETGVFLWQQLQEEKDEAQLLQAILSEYDVNEQSAKDDINEFLNNLEKHGLLDTIEAN